MDSSRRQATGFSPVYFITNSPLIQLINFFSFSFKLYFHLKLHYSQTLESIVFSFSPFSKSSLFVYMLNMSDGRFYKKYLQFEHTFCIIQKKHKLNLHGRFLQLLVLFDIYFVEAKKKKESDLDSLFFTLFRVSHVRKYDEHSF